MAIDLCSEISSAGISPRISFSHDLKNAKDDDAGDDPLEEDHRRRRSDLCLLDSSSDFVFCISNNVLSQELSSADELFSNGKIVPMEVKRSKSPNASSSSNCEIQRFSDSYVRPRSETSITVCTEKKKKRLVEFLSEEEKPPSRSFWQFKRSSSLNYEATRGKSLIRSLQFLSRSKSTGSSLNPKQSEIPKETQKQRVQKQSSVSSRRPSLSSSSSSPSSSFSSSSTFYFYSSSRNHPSLNKKCRSSSSSSSSGNGVRISPVLNLPQAYIPKAYEAEHLTERVFFEDPNVQEELAKLYQIKWIEGLVAEYIIGLFDDYLSIVKRYIEERCFKECVEACLEETMVVCIDHLQTQKSNITRKTIERMRLDEEVIMGYFTQRPSVPAEVVEKLVGMREDVPQKDAKEVIQVCKEM